MSRTIDDDMMEQLEILAKLDLTEGEREKVREELEMILAYVEKLQEADTDHVEPLIQFSLEGNVFREDVVTNRDGKAAALFNAPRREKDQYVVPKTI